MRAYIFGLAIGVMLGFFGERIFFHEENPGVVFDKSYSPTTEEQVAWSYIMTKCTDCKCSRNNNE